MSTTTPTTVSGLFYLLEDTPLLNGAQIAMFVARIEPPPGPCRGDPQHHDCWRTYVRHLDILSLPGRSPWSRCIYLGYIASGDPCVMSVCVRNPGPEPLTLPPGAHAFSFRCQG
jgi:hypothetical protein